MRKFISVTAGLGNKRCFSPSSSVPYIWEKHQLEEEYKVQVGSKAACRGSTKWSNLNRSSFIGCTLNWCIEGQLYSSRLEFLLFIKKKFWKWTPALNEVQRRQFYPQTFPALFESDLMVLRVLPRTERSKDWREKNRERFSPLGVQGRKKGEGLALCSPLFSYVHGVQGEASTQTHGTQRRVTGVGVDILTVMMMD